MMVGKVGFITPENEVCYMNYHDVLTYCKEICEQEENHDSFLEFSKDYDTFLPYFDFVMIKLHYLFLNPLFRENMCAYAVTDEIFVDSLVSFDYQENKEQFERYGFKNTTPYMSLVSTPILGMKTFTPTTMEESLIGPNLVGFMCQLKNCEPLHVVTANTVMNQLLMLSSSLENNFYQYTLDNDNLSEEDDPINYMITHLGFLRTTEPDVYPLMLGNQNVFTEEESQFVQECVQNGYHFYSFDVDAPSMILEYQDSIRTAKR